MGIRILPLYLAGEYDQAAAECRKMLELDPNFDLAHACLGDVYVQKGDLSGAIKELETAVNLTEGGNPRAIAHLGFAYARADRSDDAQIQLARLTQISNEQTRYVHPSLVAEVYAGLGRKEDAFVWLEKAYNVRSRSPHCGTSHTSLACVPILGLPNYCGALAFPNKQH